MKTEQIFLLFLYSIKNRTNKQKKTDRQTVYNTHPHNCILKMLRSSSIGTIDWIESNSFIDSFIFQHHLIVTIVVVVVVVVVVFFKQTQLTKTLCETLESRTLLVWPFSCFCWLVGRSIDDWFETDFLLFFYVILCSEYKNTWFVLTCTRRDDGVHHHHYLCWRRENIWLIDSRLFIKSKKKFSEMIPIDFHSIILFWWRWVVCVIRVGYYKNFLFSFFFFKQLLYWPSKNNWKTLTHTLWI